jgi:hypothetical protein
MVVENIQLSNLCLCGCKQETTFYKGKYRKFISGHNTGKGVKHPRYKGYTVNHYGYKLIKDHNHPNRNKHNYVPEHVKVFTEFYKCCMTKWGIVHHENENKQDNRIQNLRGMTRRQHKNHHFPILDKSLRFCLFCHSETTQLCKYTECYQWFRYNDGWLCRSCYRKFIWV